MTGKHIVFVQYGDYVDAVERFARGGEETYAAQRHSVEFVASLTKDASVTVICLPGKKEWKMLSNGVQGIGLGWSKHQSISNLIRTLEKLAPTDVVLSTPLLPVLLWALVKRLRILPIFADSFSSETQRQKLSHRLLGATLNLKHFELVANHNLPASRELVRIGVDARKVIPWDWPTTRSPHQFTSKEAPESGEKLRVFFAGAVTESKGVSDLICAVSLLRKKHRDVTLSIAGDGELDAMKKLAESQGILNHVTFLGRIPNAQVFELMRSHDAVVVPSRPTYPEGLPLTIYEALCSRSPLFLSTHPMFMKAFEKQTEGVSFFRSADPEDLAKSIETVLNDNSLYRRLSESSALAWESIQVQQSRIDLLSGWLSANPQEIARLKRGSLQAAYTAP